MININKRKAIIFCLLIFILFCFFNFENKTVYADELSDNIKEQLENLDLTGLSDFFNENIGSNDIDFFAYINSLLNGEYSVDYTTIFNHVLNTFLTGVYDSLPVFISIAGIAVLFGVVKNISDEKRASSTNNVLLFVCLLSIILILFTQILSLYKNVENIIKNIAILTEIMSPIIVTLMLAIGAKASVAAYTPTVAFLSGGVINIMLTVVLPLIGLTCIFNIVSTISQSIKFTKFADFFAGIIKWILGLTILIFGFFISIQGITSAHFDGISIRAAKYAISNSIPIVGGFLKDGFDIIVAGGILIKNTIGVSVLFLLFVMIIKPLLSLGTFSILLKFTAAIIEPISEPKISDACISISKTITYLTSVLLIVGMMLFIMILLMIFSANAFI